MDMIAVVVAIGFLLFLLILLRKSSSISNLPPGSFGWPLLGETLQFLTSQRTNAGQEFFQERIEIYGGDVFKTHVLGSPTAVFYSPLGNRFLFSNENKLVQSAWPSSLAKLFGNSLLSKVGDEAKDVRKVLLNFLKPEALQSFVGRADSIISDQVKRFWIGETQIKAFPLSKRCLFAVACSLFLSMDEGPLQSDLYAHFIDVLNGMLQIPLDFPGTLYRKARIGSNRIRGILQSVIEKRRADLASGSASPQQDLLSFLLCNADGSGNGLRDDEIKDNIMLLLMAGHDTSVVTVTLLLRNLALNPDCYQKVLQEQMEIKREKEAIQVGVLQWEDLQKMKYTWRAAQETLRLYPPAGGTWRKTIVDISYAGFSIPRGWKGILKINTDGSSKGNPGPAGIGGVGRDSKGDVQFVSSIYKGHHTNNLMEVIAILYAMKNAWDLGWRRLICESDSQVVIRLLNQQPSKVVSWKLAFIVDQIHNLCISLEFVTFTHIPREWTMVADCLAKWASDHMCTWNIVDKIQLPMGLSHQLDHSVDLDRAV